jgi:TolB protein
VVKEVGWDFLATLDRVWESMEALPPPGLGPESWNKAGRAFDIQRELNTGSHPLVEVVPESTGCNAAAAPCTGTETWWRLYVRARHQDGRQGEPLRTRPWVFQARYSGNTTDYESGGRARVAIPAGYYVDLTQLAADFGWERVPAAPTWRTFFPATLFWHFERRDNLTWEQAMLELYAAKELNQALGGFAP